MLLKVVNCFQLEEQISYYIKYYNSLLWTLLYYLCSALPKTYSITYSNSIIVYVYKY